MIKIENVEVTGFEADICFCDEDNRILKEIAKGETGNEREGYLADLR